MPMLMTSVKLPARTALGEGEDIGARTLDIIARRRRRTAAQRHVERRPALGPVDRRARKHRLAPALDIRRPGKREERIERCGIELFLRDVDAQVFEGEGEPLEPCRIVGEQRAQMGRAQARSLAVNPLPGGLRAGS